MPVPSCRSPRRVRLVVFAAAAAGALVLTGCAPGGSAPASTQPNAVSTDPGTDKVALVLHDGQGVSKLDDALIAGFEKEHPNITITGNYDPDSVHAQNLPRVMSGDDPPDLAAISSVTSEVKDGIYLNLDAYAKAYGWDKLGSQLTGGKVSSAGVAGEGSLYGFPLGYSFEGIYYNKKLAAQLGITTLPTTIDEFTADLAAAKKAGVTGIIAAGSLGLGTTAFQNLLDAYAGPKPVTEWVYDHPGATIDTPEALKAATTLKEWIDAGYFNSDVNATTQDQSYSRFADGQALFMMQGTWADSNIAPAAAKDSYGFFGPLTDGTDGPKTAISGGSFIAISSKSKHPDQAAAFLNWLQSPAAQKIVLAQGNMPVSTGTKVEVEEGTITAQMVDVFDTVSAADGLVPFVQNATSGINNTAWVPETQRLFGNQSTPKEFVEAIQKAYTTELGR